MSRKYKHVPKFGKYSPELLGQAKTLVNAWRDALREHTKREDNSYLNGIDNNKAIQPDSLTAMICGWILENPDWDLQWNRVLERVPKCAFLQVGYKACVPNLYWLFSPKGSTAHMLGRSRGAERGIDRVLQGTYDRFTTGYRPATEDDIMM